MHQSNFSGPNTKAWALGINQYWYHSNTSVKKYNQHALLWDNTANVLGKREKWFYMELVKLILIKLENV